MAQSAEKGAESVPPSEKVSKRSKRRVRTERLLRTLWITGHIVTIIGTVLELLSYLLLIGRSVWSVRLYHLTFVLIFVTYLIALTKKFNGQIPTIWTILPLENGQYGIISLFWIFYPRRVIKLVPFFVYAVLQVADFLATKVLSGANREKVKDLLNKHYENWEKVAAYANFIILVSLIIDVILLRTGSFISLCVFGFIYRIRVAYNPMTRHAIGTIMSKLDTLSNKLPEKYQRQWKEARYALEHSESTPLTRDTAPPPPKPKSKKKAYGGKDSNLWLD